MKNVIIRLEKKEDYRKVENLVRESFWNIYRPGCLEHFVLHQLRKSGEYATPKSYFVNEKEAEEFDQLFPYKEKKTIPGQLL